MTKEQIHPFIYTCAAALTLAGAVLQIAEVQYALYIFAAGTLLLIYSHLHQIFITRDDDFRTRRLARIGFLSSLILLLGDYFLFTGSNAWVVFLFIYAVVTLTLSFRSGGA